MSLILNPKEYHGECLAFHDREIILREDGSPLCFADLLALQKADDNANVIFIEPEYNICALKLRRDTIVPQGYCGNALRLHNDKCDERIVLRNSRAKGLAEWLDATRFCNRCGTPLQPSSEFTALQCPHCGNLVFPRIEPCIITLVRRGEEMLLARHAQRNQNIYACIAGFMEAGETAEQTVAREVFEETGIKVKNIRYFGSQSWPYPSQLMLAFTAEYESGELKLQEEEIADAGWFTPENSPATPPPGSIAYRLIHESK